MGGGLTAHSAVDALRTPRALQPLAHAAAAAAGRVTGHATETAILHAIMEREIKKFPRAILEWRLCVCWRVAGAEWLSLICILCDER